MLINVAEDRRPAPRSPGAPYRRNHPIPGFVGEGEVGAQPRRVCFRRGQSRRFPAWIAASSRWVARFCGFWQVQFRAWRSLPTWSR